MATLNKHGAKLMMKHSAHCATDVTGFGILGHLRNLAASQLAEVDFELTRLPILANALRVDKQRHDFKLIEGFSAETSGGLLVALPQETATQFAEESKGWIVGRVVKGSRQGRIIEDVEVIAV
jgi:selenide,water dikinase